MVVGEHYFSFLNILIPILPETWEQFYQIKGEKYTDSSGWFSMKTEEVLGFSCV